MKYVVAEEIDDIDTFDGDEESILYNPQPEGDVIFVSNFQSDDVFNVWKKSMDNKYDNQVWTHDESEDTPIAGDKVIYDKKQFYFEKMKNA